VAACGARTCGDDGCGGSCGACTDGKACLDGTCACVLADHRGCGGSALYWFDSCGNQGTKIVDCANGCDPAGPSCLDCTPACTDHQCGEDGCGGTCGTCTGGKACVVDQCLCTAQDHKTCVGNAAYWVDSCGVQGDKVQDCTGGTACQAGACVCVPQDHATCVDNASWWVDSCGVLGVLRQNCTGGTACQAGACVCVTQDHKTCVGNATYWVDSCGVQGDKDQDCTGGTICQAGACACVPQDHKTCVGDAVYWVDSCGVQGAKVQDCTGGATCQDGVCACAGETYTTCIGNTVQWVDTCGNPGDVVETCADGKTCQAGACVCTNLDFTTCVGNAVHRIVDCVLPGTTLEQCTVGRVCTDGACSCIPDDHTTCVGNQVWQADSCGALGSKVMDCTGALICKDGVCACVPQDHQACSGNAIYWIDSCGALGLKVQDCTGGQACRSAACVCLPYDHKFCANGAMYWADSCGGNVEWSEDCPTGCNAAATGCLGACEAQCLGKDCGDDGCGGSCGACDATRTCQAGVCTCRPLDHKECIGNTYYWFDSCGIQGVLAEACTGGKLCMAGTCQCRTGESRTCVGNAVYWVDSCGVTGTLDVACQANQQCVIDGSDARCTEWDGNLGACSGAMGSLCADGLGTCFPTGLCYPLCNALTQDCGLVGSACLLILMSYDQVTGPLYRQTCLQTIKPPLAPGEPCSSSNACAAGLQCTPVLEPTTCRKICRDSTTCAANEVCNIEDGVVGFCGPWDGTYGPCDPATPDCAGGLGYCHPGRRCLPLCDVFAGDCDPIVGGTLTCVVMTDPRKAPLVEACLPITQSPPLQEGDACTLATDCARGLQCMDVGTGQTSCFALCRDAADCGANQQCDQLGGGVGVCMPWNGTYGECDPASADCNGGVGYCTPGGICLPRCDVMSPVCPYITWGTLGCTYLSSDPAAPPWIQVCEPITATPPKQDGEACNLVTDCDLGLRCDNVGAERKCVRYCLDISECPTDQVCNLVGEGMGVCGKWDGTYGTCDPAAGTSCHGGLGYCVPNGYCLPVCDVVARNCPTDGGAKTACHFFTNPSSWPVIQMCLLITADPPKQEDAPCSAKSECASGLVCDGFGGQASRCLKICTVEADCTAPKLCQMYNSYWGVCAVD
jgi:hypothetical protein